MHRVTLLIILAGALLLSACAEPLMDKARYATTMLDHLQRTMAVLGNVQTLATNPRFEDPAWQTEITQEIATIRSLISEARAITPPEAVADVHRSYLDAMQSLESLTTTIDQAVALRDSAQLQEAMRLINETRRLIEEAGRAAGS